MREVNNTCLDEVKPVILSQIENLSAMLGQIDVLLEKPPKRYDKNLNSSLEASLLTRKLSIKGLLDQSEFFLKQMDGMELACKCRHQSR
jgi:hypothetical protein